MNQKGIIPIIVVLITLIVVTGGYLAYSKFEPTTISIPSPQPYVSATPSSTSASSPQTILNKDYFESSISATEWLEFNSPRLGIKFKYPSGWQVTGFPTALSIIKPGPGAFEPGSPQVDITLYESDYGGRIRGSSNLSSVTIDGLKGTRYLITYAENSPPKSGNNTFPEESIELPYRGGILEIYVIEDPLVITAALFNQILSTIKFIK